MFKTQKTTHLVPNLRKIRLVCLFIVVNAVYCPLASRADGVTEATPTETNTPPSAAVTTNSDQPAVTLPAAAVAPVVTTNPPTSTATPTSEPTGLSKATPTNRPFGIEAEGGTTGGGGEVTWRFVSHFGLRAGLDYFQHTFSSTVQNVNYDLKVKLLSEPVALDWFPFRKSTFHISLGALINQNDITGFNGNSQNVIINGNSYTVPADALSMSLKQPAALPYASLGGTLYLGKQHRWSLGGEIGVAYGRWDASFSDSTFTISPADIAAEKNQIENEANKYPVWPIVKVGVGYSF